MTEQNIKSRIAAVRAELDILLAIGDREAIIRSIALLTDTWTELLKKDAGLFHTHNSQRIWVDETARGESSFFADIRGVDDVVRKNRLIRHAFFRLENDFPDDMCLEAMHTLSEMNLSDTAFCELLASFAEDGERVRTRIGEIAQSHA